MKYLQKTRLLDYDHPSIVSLIKRKGWQDLEEKDRILKAYNFVRDEIVFGYNIDDALSSSEVLKDGYGQCNTKGILLMSLFRSLGIPCRMHGFYIDKSMQQGAVKGIYYKLAPNEIVHSWVEVYYKDRWLNLEGFILDKEYLSRLQEMFPLQSTFCGYGAATNDFVDPPIEWDENDTYIQKEGITQDLGVYDDPDDFFIRYSQGLGRFKTLIYRNFVRHIMNQNVKKIRRK